MTVSFIGSRGEPEEYKRSLTEKVGHVLIIDEPADHDRARKLKELME